MPNMKQIIANHNKAILTKENRMENTKNIVCGKMGRGQQGWGVEGARGVEGFHRWI